MLMRSNPAVLAAALALATILTSSSSVVAQAPGTVTRPFAVAPTAAAAPQHSLSDAIADSAARDHPFAAKPPPAAAAPAKTAVAAAAAGPAKPAAAAAAPKNCISALGLLLASPRNFSMFSDLVLASGLAASLADGRLNGTLFAVTNAGVAAFTKTLNLSTAELLSADQGLLKQVVAYHMVPGRQLDTVQLARAANGTLLPTALAGHKLKIALAPKAQTSFGIQMLGEIGPAAPVAGISVPACGAVVNILSRVLVPAIAASAPAAKAPMPQTAAAAGPGAAAAAAGGGGSAAAGNQPA